MVGFSSNVTFITSVTYSLPLSRMNEEKEDIQKN